MNMQGQRENEKEVAKERFPNFFRNQGLGTDEIERTSLLENVFSKD